MQITSWQDFAGAKVALLGSALENTSLIPHLLRHGAEVTVCEWNEDRANRIKETFPKVNLSIGEKYLHGLDRFDLLFRSPGFPVNTVEKALVNLKPPPSVSSATDLFLALTKSVVIGVTGSKGKGTTSTMIGSILEATGKKVVVAGNIGRPIFDIFNDLTKDTVVVLELSSFQLEDLRHSPNVAVVLAITENDHLQPLSADSPNFHASVNDYVAAKAHITLFQTASNHLVYVADNDYAISIAQVSKSQKTSVSQSSKDADFFVDQKGIVWTNGKELVNLSKLGLLGQHVFLNTTVAVAVSKILNCREVDIVQGIVNFRPLPHRLEQFAEINGVKYVDDSYATAPEAAIAAIGTFTDPMVWIAGGSSKGASFDELARVVANSSVKKAILIGDEAPRIQESLSHFAQRIAVDTPKTLAEAVRQAKNSAKSGDVVLLSPACASKDMFQNAADRGDQFKHLVTNATKSD
ncbi:MAG: UDP-N-acetylmuramoyl-L-alanine--D-glutamate ligase [Candidatus Berkelbacteria bacterium]|nr:UDP-N-acetylmuramoyl-L-alanine--D-glutamate ligase [Candidatus Berkelbacteria bacterium]